MKSVRLMMRRIQTRGTNGYYPLALCRQGMETDLYQARHERLDLDRSTSDLEQPEQSRPVDRAVALRGV